MEIETTSFIFFASELLLIFFIQEPRTPNAYTNSYFPVFQQAIDAALMQYWHPQVCRATKAFTDFIYVLIKMYYLYSIYIYIYIRVFICMCQRVASKNFFVEGDKAGQMFTFCFLVS